MASLGWRVRSTFRSFDQARVSSFSRIRRIRHGAGDEIRGESLSEGCGKSAGGAEYALDRRGGTAHVEVDEAQSTREEAGGRCFLEGELLSRAMGSYSRDDGRWKWVREASVLPILRDARFGGGGQLGLVEAGRGRHALARGG
jgi:hypothetical protein